MLNQLSLYASAQSFMDPDADADAVAADFYRRLFGADGPKLVPYLPLFEIVQDWGNYHNIDLPRDDYHRRMRELVDLLGDLAGQERHTPALHPSPERHREELLWFARLFADLSAPAPDYDALSQRYWQRVYAIYDRLPDHVDPRPRNATQMLINVFRNGKSGGRITAGKRTD
jgi:hypothetical protein